jgi:hypothetical protein
VVACFVDIGEITAMVINSTKFNKLNNHL